jgi:hypothetical protein
VSQSYYIKSGVSIERVGGEVLPDVGNWNIPLIGEALLKRGQKLGIRVVPPRDVFGGSRAIFGAHSLRLVLKNVVLDICVAGAGRHKDLLPHPPLE